MSRIGKVPVSIPSGVSVEIAGRKVTAKGPKGLLSMSFAPEVTVAQAEGALRVTPRDKTKRARQQWGLARNLIKNMMTGVSAGFTRELEINGVGYRAQVSGKSLSLDLGFSHPIVYPIPDGIQIKCDKPTSIAISGTDAQQVGQVAAEIRRMRPPEPYKGKGIKYAGEYVRRKEGKKK